jgi:hypothetical protein
MRVREKLVEEGLDAVLTRKKRETPPVAPIFDGKRQAQLIALACSEPPAGHARWTIRLLANAVALQIWCTVHGFAHLLLEGQIAAPPGGGSAAGQLPDIAGLLLGSVKERKKREGKARRR